MNLKNIFLLIISFLCISVTYAKKNDYLTIKNIVPTYNNQLSGLYPSIRGNQFAEVNNSIINFITTNFDQKNQEDLTEISFTNIFQDKNILSFSIDYNTSNTTERYFNKYYTLDLSKKKEINLTEYLKQKAVSKNEVLNNINHFLAPCLSIDKSSPDYCLDMTIQNLIENKKVLHYADISGFFVKKQNVIGLGIDSNKFTTTFIYNIITKKVSLD